MNNCFISRFPPVITGLLGVPPSYQLEGSIYSLCVVQALRDGSDHRLSESSSLVDARVTVEDLCLAIRQSGGRRQGGERRICRIVSARCFLERNRALGEVELQRAVLMIAGRVACQRRQPGTMHGAARKQ